MEEGEVCTQCHKLVPKLVKKNRSGEILNICRGCYYNKRYEIKTEDNPIKYKKGGLKCDHPKKRGHSACGKCYGEYWRETASFICVKCGKKTKLSITPICPECKSSSVVKRRNPNDEDIQKIKIFLIKSKWNYLTPIDTLKMIDLYLNIGLNEVVLGGWTNPKDCQTFLLETFKKIWNKKFQIND